MAATRSDREELPPPNPQGLPPSDDQQRPEAPAAAAVRPRQPRPTHFVSLRVRAEAVLDAVGEMQQQHCAAEPALSQYAIEPVRLHLTLLVLALPTPEAVKRTAAALRASCADAMAVHFPEGCAVELDGLASFPGNKVVFVNVAEGPTRERLCSFAAAVGAPLRGGAHALPPEWLVDSPFVPHATVYKLSNARRRKKRDGPPQLKRFPPELWASHKDTPWGQVYFECVELSAMQGRPTGEYYLQEAAVPFPGRVASANKAAPAAARTARSAGSSTEESKRDAPRAQQRAGCGTDAPLLAALRRAGHQLPEPATRTRSAVPDE